MWRYFSLQHQHIAKPTGDENKESNQLEDIVLMYHQILITEITKYDGYL